MSYFPLHAAEKSKDGPIQWRPETRVLIQPGGGYGRMARLGAGQRKGLLCAFTWQRALCVRRSDDEGRTWSEPVKAAEWAEGALANAELLVLRNGDVLAFFNRRPDQRNPGTGGAPGPGAPHSIGCCRSTDGGRTWGPQVTIDAGEPVRDKGCWEPAGLELPDGRIAVWFANENPFPEGHDQEISVTLSADHGATWSAPQRFSYRAGSRDGMPVPALAADGKSVQVAIEDNGLSGAFKPVVLTAPLTALGSTGSPSSKPEKLPFIDARSPRRQGALADPLPAVAYAGAPYLRVGQGAGGRAVLSFQLAADGDMKHSRMAVCVAAGPRAEKFGPPGYPFGNEEAKDAPAQLWNAVFFKDAKTVTAITETSIDGKKGIWAIDGELR